MRNIVIAQNYVKNREGSIAAEAALIFPFFLIALLGLVEITQFIQAKERLNKVSNQVTKVLSVPTSQADIAQVLTVAMASAEPESPSVNVMLCRYSLGGGLEFTFQASSGGSGTCGFGTRGGGANLAATCPPAPSESNPGYASTVNVTSSCSYYPMFDFLNLFGGLQVVATTSMPMQGDPESAFTP